MQSPGRRTLQLRRSVQNLLFKAHADSKLRTFRRELSNLAAGPPRFGIAFDIDGVLLRGGKPIGGAPQALQQLYDNPSHPGQLRVPYVFLTNGGGTTEAARAAELSQQLGVPVSPNQVLLGHTPFKTLVDRFRDKRVLAVGKGEPDVIMTSYGFQQVIHMDSYVYEFDNIDALARYKPWFLTKKGDTHVLPNHDAQVAAVFVTTCGLVTRFANWSLVIGFIPCIWVVICDVLRSDGHPGTGSADRQTPIYFAADDLEYQSTFPVPRLGMGAFRIALQSIYNQLPLAPLVYTSFGKPQPIFYKDAENVLQQIRRSMLHTPNNLSKELMHGLSFPPPVQTDPPPLTPLKTVYMIGDNPVTDIKGAKSSGEPWFAILTRTGCYQEGQPLNSMFLADKVVEDVEEAVHFICEREGLRQS